MYKQCVQNTHTHIHTPMNISGKLFQCLNVVLLGKISSPTLPALRGKKTLISKHYQKKKKNRWEYPECDYHQERKENTLQGWRNENKRQETMLITCGNMDSSLTHFGSTVNGFLMKRSLCPRSSAILSSLILFQMFITLK